MTSPSIARIPTKTVAVSQPADKASIQAATLKVQHLLYAAVQGGNKQAHDTLREMASDLTNNPELVKVLALGLAAFQLGEKRFDLSDLAATPAKVSEKMAILMRESERRTDALTRTQARVVSTFTE